MKCPTTFEKLEKIKRASIAGLVLLTDNDNIGIFYNQNSSIIRKRFTIVHEIGHCCLHGEILKDWYIEFLNKDGLENNHEIEATVFASKLLIPEDSLRRVYVQLILPSSYGLADIFGVPVSLMKYRLEELRLKYFDE